MEIGYIKGWTLQGSHYVAMRSMALKKFSERFRNAKFYNFKYPRRQKKNPTDINIDTQIRIIVWKMLNTSLLRHLIFNIFMVKVSKLKGAQNFVKVAFSQKGLMRSSFLQTDEPNYFPELEFWFFFSF